ncbi:hypothetical protein ACEYW6_18685 [Nostoc sp. UIC 10607]|uniref:hypothetical protein n=1 Tax=Nostoc sp. UIC 10607 TaxID=3045935 RepID=UPI00399F228F
MRYNITSRGVGAGSAVPLRVYLAWTVFENSANIQVGIVALLAIAPNNGRAEIGHVWFTPAVHKTKVNS